jgi:hypothetical protein
MSFRHLRARRLLLRPQDPQRALLTSVLRPAFAGWDAGANDMPRARALPQETEPGCLANHSVAAQSDLGGDLRARESGVDPIP